MPSFQGLQIDATSEKPRSWSLSQCTSNALPKPAKMCVLVLVPTKPVIFAYPWKQPLLFTEKMRTTYGDLRNASFNTISLWRCVAHTPCSTESTTFLWLALLITKYRVRGLLWILDRGGRELCLKPELVATASEECSTGPGEAARPSRAGDTPLEPAAPALVAPVVASSKGSSSPQSPSAS